MCVCVFVSRVRIVCGVCRSWSFIHGGVLDFSSLELRILGQRSKIYRVTLSVGDEVCLVSKLCRWIDSTVDCTKDPVVFT